MQLYLYIPRYINNQFRKNFEEYVTLYRDANTNEIMT